MRISISNIAWDNAHDNQICAILRRHAIDAIDIAPGKYFKDFALATPAQMKAVREWWSDRGIEIIGMQSLLYGTEGLNLFSEPDVQGLMLNHLRHVCRIGNELNARLLVFGSPRNRDRSGISDEAVLEIATAFFLQLAEAAAEYGVTICLEPNPECYGSNFMTSTADTAAVVKAVAHPALKMQLDTGAACINGESPTSLCAEFHDLIGHIHACEPQLVPVGSGETDHGSFAAAIRAFLPEAVVTIEMLTGSSDDPLAAVESSLACVNRYYCSANGGG